MNSISYVNVPKDLSKADYGVPVDKTVVSDEKQAFYLPKTVVSDGGAEGIYRSVAQTPHPSEIEKDTRINGCPFLSSNPVKTPVSLSTYFCRYTIACSFPSYSSLAIFSYLSGKLFLQITTSVVSGFPFQNNNPRYDGIRHDDRFIAVVRMLEDEAK